MRAAGALIGETVAVVAPDTFEQAVSLHLAKVVAESGKRVGGSRRAEDVEDGLMDVGAPPAVELRTAMQQHLHQPHHPGIVDLDAGDFGLAGHDRERNLLK